MSPLLKCISKADANCVLRDIHEGVFGSHSRSRMLAHKVVKSGHYWLHMNEDSANFVRNCNKCQRFARVMKNPLEELSSISAPWPFAQWGVDLMGPLPKGNGGCKFIVVVVDYFTKRAEAEVLAKIMATASLTPLWSKTAHSLIVTLSENGARSYVCGTTSPHPFIIRQTSKSKWPIRPSRQLWRKKLKDRKGA
jgi:hypothetical protein